MTECRRYDTVFVPMSSSPGLTGRSKPIGVYGRFIPMHCDTVQCGAWIVTGVFNREQSLSGHGLMSVCVCVSVCECVSYLPK